MSFLLNLPPPSMVEEVARTAGTPLVDLSECQTRVELVTEIQFKWISMMGHPIMDISKEFIVKVQETARLCKPGQFWCITANGA